LKNLENFTTIIHGELRNQPQFVL